MHPQTLLDAVGLPHHPGMQGRSLWPLLRGKGELYDLERDPQETHDLWDDADSAQVKTEMLIRLCNRMAWTVDLLPLRRAAW